MRWRLGFFGLSLLLTLERTANAEVVRDDGDFGIEFTAPEASLCTALPVQANVAAACTPSDLALGQAFAGANARGARPFSVVVAHFDGWETSMIVMKDSEANAESNQSQADKFAGGFREGIRKNLPPDAHVVDADRPMRGDVLRIGELQVIRAVVKVEAPSNVPLTSIRSKIAYEVEAKNATYTLVFSFDLAHYDQAFALAQRTIETARATPARIAPPIGSVEAESQRGRRWGLIFAVGVLLIFAAMKWVNRKRDKR